MNLLSKLLSIVLLMSALAACTTETVSDDGAGKNIKQASSINVQLGLQYLNQGSISRAKQKLLLAVRQNASAQSYGAIAYFYERTSEIDNAQQFYLKAISEAPEAGAGHNNYGAFLCRQGQYQQAEQQFQQAVADPNYLNDAGAYENAGLCALLIPDQAKAVSYFKQALKQNPRRAVALAQLAQIAFQNKQYVQANNYLQRYIKTNNLSPATLLLGVRVAKHLKRSMLMREYGFLLKQRFPDSKEYKQYLRM